MSTKAYSTWRSLKRAPAFLDLHNAFNLLVKVSVRGNIFRHEQKFLALSVAAVGGPIPCAHCSGVFSVWSFQMCVLKEGAYTTAGAPRTATGGTTREERRATTATKGDPTEGGRADTQQAQQAGSSEGFLWLK